jgi:hypothetical protein
LRIYLLTSLFLLFTISGEIKEVNILGGGKFMESKWTGLRAIREEIPPSQGAGEMHLDVLEKRIIDLRKTLTGDTSATRWKELKAELTNREESLRNLLETRNHNCLAGNERYSSLVELRPRR